MGRMSTTDIPFIYRSRVFLYSLVNGSLVFSFRASHINIFNMCNRFQYYVTEQHCKDKAQFIAHQINFAS